MSTWLYLEGDKVLGCSVSEQEGWVEVSEDDPRYLKFISVADELSERSWRDAELVRADEELNKVQDADPKAKGTVADWRTYRKALRNYPSVEGFPSKDLRPVSP